MTKDAVSPAHPSEEVCPWANIEASVFAGQSVRRMTNALLLVKALERHGLRGRISPASSADTPPNYGWRHVQVHPKRVKEAEGFVAGWNARGNDVREEEGE